MPDAHLPERGIGLGEALSRLPLESPGPDAWPALAARLSARRRRPRRRLALALAAAAALVLAVLLPGRLAPPGAGVGEAGDPVAASTVDDGALPSLMAESARLEHLLRAMTDDQAGSATATVLGLDLEDRLGLVDAALAEPGLDPAKRQLLWQQRVALLREYTGLQGTRQWLAADGQRLDGTLVATF